jgi:Zn-finger protein
MVVYDKNSSKDQMYVTDNEHCTIIHQANIFVVLILNKLLKEKKKK